jgi:protein-S-isoprenylcysteine O-methyltransferase Ste14
VVLLPALITGGRTAPPFFGQASLGVGAALLAAGLLLLLDNFARFALEGLGTPAPVAPTERLVDSGAYRVVRNPIYLAVVSMILAEALLMASTWLLIYAAIVAVASHLFIVFYEEPRLRRRFGEAYDSYAERTPRWAPRIRAFRAGPPTSA